MYDVVIIGAGPAGASAAIFTSKAGKKTLLIDSEKSLTKRAWVENHYGVEGIDGPALLEKGINQATKLGTDFTIDTVVNIVKEDDFFSVETESNSVVQAKHVLLATGVLADLAEKVGLKVIPGTEPRIKSNIKVDSEGKTNINGIWAAGTVAGVSVHTIVTAGHGAAVAINIISEINGERYVDHDLLT
ncbi:FAD-dependent oxidoreductase [Evansella sp. AB-rgal1]|uniref:FAD-dependent oxidoreductase n=1 Tax=Evansella sp. AB-rgal1 TaxID=3242696 RepID=UPI00359DA8D7